MAVTAQEVAALLRARPFKPFDIWTSRTGTYRISSPESAWITRSTLYIGMEIDAEGVPAQAQQVPLSQITALTLSPPAPRTPQANE